MSSKPDFDRWAKQILDRCTEPEENDIIMHISKFLRKCWESGYRYAVANDWWQEREKCEHQGDGLYYLSNPPQYKCDKCGAYFK